MSFVSGRHSHVPGNLCEEALQQIQLLRRARRGHQLPRRSSRWGQPTQIPADVLPSNAYPGVVAMARVERFHVPHDDITQLRR